MTVAGITIAQIMRKNKQKKKKILLTVIFRADMKRTTRNPFCVLTQTVIHFFILLERPQEQTMGYQLKQRAVYVFKGSYLRLLLCLSKTTNTGDFSSDGAGWRASRNYGAQSPGEAKEQTLAFHTTLQRVNPPHRAPPRKFFSLFFFSSPFFFFLLLAEEVKT